MTELSEILKSTQDTIFTVDFKKKVAADNVYDKLNRIAAADLKNDAKLN